MINEGKSLEILAVENSDIFKQDMGPMATTDNTTAVLNEYKIYDIFNSLGFKVKLPKDARPVVKENKASKDFEPL